MPVHMPWMKIEVVVIDDDFDSFIVLYHYGVDLTVDHRVQKIFLWQRECGVECRDFW